MPYISPALGERVPRHLHRMRTPIISGRPLGSCFCAVATRRSYGLCPPSQVRRAVLAKRTTMASAETPFDDVDMPARRSRSVAAVPAVPASAEAEPRSSRVPWAALRQCHRASHRCAQEQHATSIPAMSCLSTAPMTRLRSPTPSPRRAAARPWWTLPHTPRPACPNTLYTSREPALLH